MQKLASAMSAGVLLSCLQAIAPVGAQSVTRLPLPDNNDFPISAAVTVSAGLDTYYLSGATAPVIDKDAPKGSSAAYGDMETQATNTLQSIQKTLARLGLTMGDVVKMTVFMVGDQKDNHLDFAGFMTGYKKFFGTTEQPNKPSRSAFQIVALAAPGALIEIEVIAAKAPATPAKKQK